MHRIDGDVQVHAVRNNEGTDENRRRLEVCTGLSAACAAEGISEGAALRLDGIELADDARAGEVARVAVSRLDALARQPRGSAAAWLRSRSGIRIASAAKTAAVH